MLISTFARRSGLGRFDGQALYMVCSDAARFRPAHEHEASTATSNHRAALRTSRSASSRHSTASSRRTEPGSASQQIGKAARRLIACGFNAVQFDAEFIPDEFRAVASVEIVAGHRVSNLVDQLGFQIACLAKIVCAIWYHSSLTWVKKRCSPFEALGAATPPRTAHSQPRDGVAAWR